MIHQLLNSWRRKGYVDWNQGDLALIWSRLIQARMDIWQKAIQRCHISFITTWALTDCKSWNIAGPCFPCWRGWSYICIFISSHIDQIGYIYIWWKGDSCLASSLSCYGIHGFHNSRDDDNDSELRSSKMMTMIANFCICSIAVGLLPVICLWHLEALPVLFCNGYWTCGCSWDTFQAYKHLKLLGFFIGRFGVPWTMKHSGTSDTDQSLNRVDGASNDISTWPNCSAVV